MIPIYLELTRLANCSEIAPELIVLTDSVATIFAGLNEGATDIRLASDESAIKNLKREP